jgi:hypothetical protein
MYQLTEGGYEPAPQQALLDLIVDDLAAAEQLVELTQRRVCLEPAVAAATSRNQRCSHCVAATACATWLWRASTARTHLGAPLWRVR